MREHHTQYSEETLIRMCAPDRGLVASVCERNLKQNRGSVNLPLKMCGQCEIFGVTDSVCD